MLATNTTKSWEIIHAVEFEKRKPKNDSPEVLNSEILLDKDKVLLSITDTKGVITYCNEDFVTVSGYQEWELAGVAHNIVRHPDMPKFIFKFMWQRIQNKDNIIAIVKNLAKSGKYYWVMTDFVVLEDNLGNITGYKAYRKPAPRKAIETIAPIYEKLCKIENARGVSAAESFFIGYLDSLNVTYDDFIESLIIDSSEQEKQVLDNKPKTKAERKSFFKKLFGY